MRNLLILLLSIPLFVKAQNDSLYKHTIGVEIGGKSVVWGDIYYEYTLYRNLSAGAGIGFTEINKRYTVPVKEYLYTNSLYLGYHKPLRPKRSSSRWLIFKGGLIMLNTTEVNTDLKTGVTTSETIAFVSAGWEIDPGKYYFRIEPHLFIGNDFYISSGLLPWIGFSLGKTF